MPPPDLRLLRFDDPGAFRERVFPFLMEREAEHNLMLGLCLQLEGRDPRYPRRYLAAVEQGDAIVAAALCTPPHALVLSHVGEPEAIDRIAEDLLECQPDLSGVLARPEAARRFIATWESATGLAAHRSMAERIHQTTVAHPPRGVPGTLRFATAGDRDRLVAWMEDLFAEAFPAGTAHDAEKAVDLRLAERPPALVLWWDDDRPVAFAGVGGRTENGARIGPVYTPPEGRRRGYATALTAALTRYLLDDGRRFCVLYTNLANPTSNAIYRRIGYEPICDVDQYLFRAG